MDQEEFGFESIVEEGNAAEAFEASAGTSGDPGIDPCDCDQCDV